MKQEWIEKKLGDLCEIELGKTPYRGDKSFWDKDKVTNNVWLSIADLLNTNGKVVSDSKEYITDKAVKLSKIVRKGTLLLSFKLTLGRLAFAGRDLFTNEAIASLVVKNDKEIDKNFLYQFLVLFDWNKATEGDHKVKGRTLNKAKLKEIVVRYPKSIKEQQRIVSILDKIFADIEKAKNIAEQNLKNSKELFESYLQNVFNNKSNDWKEEPLGEVCDTGAGGTPLKSHKDYYDNGDIPWLRSGEVNKRDITQCDLYITSKGLKNSSAKLFPVNTVLIAMYGATAGQVGILRFECSTNQAVCGILPNKNFIPEFLYYKFLAGKDALVKQAVGGAQPNISQIKIRNTVIPIIPIKEQQNIIKKLDTLSAETKRLETIYLQKLNDLEELKKSILQKAFNGEL